MLRKLVPFILAASLALTGCSLLPTAPNDPATTDSGPDVSSITTPAATGELITGSAYTYNVPEGWSVPTGINTSQFDSVAADLADTDGFNDNVNVIPSPSGALTPELIESAGVDELKSSATDVVVEDRVSIAGSESAHLSGLFESQGLTYRVEQYYATKDGTTFVVTFSFSDDLPQADRIGVAESVLASWTWT